MLQDAAASGEGLLSELREKVLELSARDRRGRTLSLGCPSPPEVHSQGEGALEAVGEGVPTRDWLPASSRGRPADLPFAGSLVWIRTLRSGRLPLQAPWSLFCQGDLFNHLIFWWPFIPRFHGYGPIKGRSNKAGSQTGNKNIRAPVSRGRAGAQ